MQLSRWAMCLAAGVLFACEDGPGQFYKDLPEGTNADDLNGASYRQPYTEKGGRTFGDFQRGDSVERAKFCDEAEQTAQLQRMVVQPILPNKAVAGIPLWGPNFTQLKIDDLIGHPSDGKFCEPTTLYLDAFAWGPTNEVIAVFNEDTRLLEYIIANAQYLGKLEGTYTNDAGKKVAITIQPREFMKIDGNDLDQYSSRADQATRTESWLNNKNVTAFYKMVRETYFNTNNALEPLSDDYDCVEEKKCDVIYTATNDAAPQDTWVVFRELGVQVRFAPTGATLYVVIVPVRKATFEQGPAISFGGPESAAMNFTYGSSIVPSCLLELSDREITWKQFREQCIVPIDGNLLDRVPYTVYPARNAVTVEFSGIQFAFARKTSIKPVFKDGERPDDDDTLVHIGFFRSLEAPVREFNPQKLGEAYKAKLQARLREALIASGEETDAVNHPFANYEIEVPASLVNRSTSIGEIKYVPTGSRQAVVWIPDVVRQVWSDYEALTADERAMLDERVLDDVFLIEPFVDAVLEIFTHGESNSENAFKGFRTSDDRRWSIGEASFVRGAENYRATVQFSLDHGAVTAVFVERGRNEIDALFDGWRIASTDEPFPFYTPDLALNPDNALGLGGDAIKVSGFNRQLNTLDVALTQASGAPLKMTVSGFPIEDRYGYQRQISGERYEFVPANVVRLYGLETVETLYVDDEGTIAAILDSGFKKPMDLCDGLSIAYGDDVRRKVDAYKAEVASAATRDCQIVFNYSENGNVLNSIVSLKNRIGFTVQDGRAVTVELWR